MGKKLIDLYKEWMDAGEINERSNPNGEGGLCNALPLEYLPTLDYVSPETAPSHSYWASGLSCDSESHEAMYKFNPLRQTIVLLICAMHDEL